MAAVAKSPLLGPTTQVLTVATAPIAISTPKTGTKKPIPKDSNIFLIATITPVVRLMFLGVTKDITNEPIIENDRMMSVDKNIAFG